ncbi:H2O-forming NADH oxidase [Vagococcus bubulae]|uniref:NADH oxidase n=1 Tax=Vagococcus bubulae TaxID=1977868 RepID=A0A429ZPE2_9ENTE|nr:FAD-dependent oxidoreductase [Vagococcus bubulae]RST95564.1 NADH oxidase [Vagococcus bubulae]
MKKTVIIGSNHAGIAAANVLLNHYHHHEVVIIEKNAEFSYLGCGTALWVGQQIDSYEGLFYLNESDFKKNGAKIYTSTEVTHVDFRKKIVTCTNLNHETFTEEYDDLILATGSKPILLNVPGKELDHIFCLKTFNDGKKVNEFTEKETIQRVAVIGAGYIGVEIAEALKRRGKKVLLFDGENRSLSGYYDQEFSSKMDETLSNNGIELHFGEKVTEYQGKESVERLITDKGNYAVDMIINAVGFLPNNDLGKQELELFRNGAYVVDEHQQTSNPSVYAVGDCATIFSNALQKMDYIALATNAVRSGIVAGHSIGGGEVASLGVQGSNAISIFGFNMSSTGLSFESATKRGLAVSYTDYEDLQKPAFMADNYNVKLRIVYETKSRRIVGAQICSEKDVSMLTHLFSLAIHKKLTIDELQLLDLFFLPHFNQPYNYITMAALNAK